MHYLLAVKLLNFS